MAARLRQAYCIARSLCDNAGVRSVTKKGSGSVMIVWEKVLPVLVSIGIILLVALLREYSRTFAAIAATMPINIPLALWIVGAGSTREQMEEFGRAVFFNIWPTIVFLVIAYFALRAGWDVLPTILAGYVGWGIGLGALMLLRAAAGV